MNQDISIDEVFENIDFTKTTLPTNDFDGCSFKGCNFNGCNLSGVSFLDCIFEECNFSMVNLDGATLKDASFTYCKLIGVDFGKCNDLLFSVSFNHCQLDYTFFYKKKLKKTQYQECSIREANFTEADMTGSVFHKCDLTRTIFDRTNLTQVDFRTAMNYSIDPEINKINKAKFSLEGIPGLLGKYNIDIV